MRIGVWLGKYDNPQIGGGFSYVDRLITAIDSYHFDPMIEICFIVEGECSWNLKSEVVILNNHISTPFLYRALLFLLPLLVLRSFKCRIKDRIQANMEEKRKLSYTDQLNCYEVKLIYYIQQSQCVLPDFPFISTNWDVGHCSTYAFPELISPVFYEIRYNFYNRYLPKALFVFAESEAGKEELIRFMQIKSSKIKVVPIFSGDCVKQIVPESQQLIYLRKSKLEKKKYFFYPAQFWAHNNHVGLLRAFSILLKDFPDYKLVFTGSDKGTLSHVLKKVDQLGLRDAVVYLGFVSTEEMNTLYQNATSLVMATYNGPTNMPPLEAMELGCPVICSDLAGHHEELGDAAIFFDPENPFDMAKAMKTVCLDNEKYIQYIKTQRNVTYFTIDNALSAINKYLCQAVQIRDNWA